MNIKTKILSKQKALKTQNEIKKSVPVTEVVVCFKLNVFA